MEVTAFSLAQRFIGVRELPGEKANPFILAMLQLDQGWPQDDAVPWCSGYVNYIAWLLRLPRSKSLRARSWLLVGSGVRSTIDAQVGFDVVILNRGGPKDATVIEAPGHVGFFAGRDTGSVLVLGGNQGDAVSVQAFPSKDLLGIRRLA